MPIEKTDFDRFMNDVRIALAGVSDTGIKQELYNVLTEFCEYSGAWQETLTVPVLAGTTTGNVNSNCNYVLTPAEDGFIIGLVGVWDPNLIPQPAFMPNFQGGEDAIGQLVLVNPVNMNQNFTVTVTKTVKEPGRDGIPVFSGDLFRRYRRTLMEGTQSRLQRQSNKPYSNSQEGGANWIRFRNGIADARIQAQRQNTLGAQAWSYPQGYRTRGQRGGVSTANPTTF